MVRLLKKTEAGAGGGRLGSAERQAARPDDGEIGPHFPESSEQHGPVGVGKVQVDHGGVEPRRIGAEPVHGFLAAAADFHLKSGALQIAGEQRDDRFFVLNEQDDRCGGGIGLGTGRVGHLGTSITLSYAFANLRRGFRFPGTKLPVELSANMSIRIG